jgi:hypothetical protein
MKNDEKVYMQLKNLQEQELPTLQMCSWDDLVQSFHPILRYYFKK